VTSAEGCTQQQAISIETFALPAPVILGDTSFCAGESFQLSANMPFAAYQWSDGASTLGTTATLDLSQAGDYSLTVFNDDGCTASTMISVDELQLPSPTIAGDAGFCEGTSTMLEAQGGNYSAYQWSTGETTADIEVASPNDYALTVTDLNGCVGQTSITVDAYPLPDFEITGTTGFCTGDSTLLTATAGYDAYQWSSASDINSTTIYEAGNYTVTVTSAEGCTQQQSIDIETFELPAPEILGVSNFCVGGSTELSSNMPFTTYQWSNGETASSITASVAGIYELMVTDANGCVGNTQIEIVDDIVITPEISGPLNFCPGTTTNLDVGAGYVSYSWSNGQDSQTIDVGSAGPYAVTVVDAEGCIGETAVEVISWEAPAPTIEGDTAFCADSQTTLNVSGGDFIAYDWSNGPQSASITTNMPGTYSVMVTDANNCQATTAVTLEAWPLPEFIIEGATAFCEDAFTTLSSSVSFPVYEWSTGADTESIQVSSSESIELTATNEFGCSAVASVNVSAIPLPIADAGDNTLINCYEPSVQLGGSSTVGPGYTVQWQGPGINTDNENEAFPIVDVAGAYTLIITDDTYGCTSLPSVVSVEDFTQSPSAILQVLDVLDCTTNTVTIDGSGSSSAATIVYQWYDENFDPIPAAQSNTLDVEAAELFYLQVLDTLSGCADMDSIWVSENLEYPIAEAGTPSTLNCAVLEVPLDGSSSQTGDQIVHSWYSTEGNTINNADDIEASVSQPGWYYISVSDTLNGCTNIDSVLIVQNIQTPDVAIAAPAIIDCLTPSVALIGAASSTGPNFTYNWAFETADNTISETINTEATQAGQYFLTITNLENMCTASSSVQVQENSAAPSDASVLVENPTCFGDDDGAIFIQEVIGGTPPYIISINGQPFTSQLQYPQLTAGNYQFIIQDAIGCEHELEIGIEESNDLQVDLGDDIELNYGDMVSLNATVNIEEEDISQIRWSYIDSLDCLDCLMPNLTATVSAPYSISVTDVNGCTSTDEVYIFVDRQKSVYLPTAFSPNGDGNNEIFYIQSGSDAVLIKSFQVFNRWGESVFEVYNAPTNDPLYGWDGNYRGEEYNSAVFTWFAEVEFLDGEIVLFKGDVLLMK
jgi:gliding motility-associated-like protein